MSTLELVLRIAACSEVLLVVFFLFSSPDRKPAALFFLGIASYLLAPLVVYVWMWGYWAYPVLAMAIVVPALFCLFMGSVFLDNGLPPIWAALLIVLTALLGLFAHSTSGSSFGVGESRLWQWLAQLLKFIWVGLGLIIVFKDWQSDLVEPRRRLRLIILGGVGAYILAVLVVELFIAQRAQAWAELANVSLILCLVTLFCRHFFAVSPHSIFAAIESKPVEEQIRSALAVDILRVLGEERFYAGESVTVKSLAAAVGSQEYRVRRAINGELGFRNFNSFINRYRIREIASRLQQSEFDTMPLLSLALDAGFRSLAPFNKAFKEHFELTPSEFRMRQKNK